MVLTPVLRLSVRLTLVATLAAAVGVAGCGGSGGNAAGPGGRRPGGAGPTVPVRTTPIQRISIERQIELSGTLLSPDQAKVSSEVAGVVRKVLVEIGSEVVAGQPLVRLDPRELELALARAESSLRQVYAQLGMHASPGATTPPPPDEEVATVKTAVANREDARAAYDRAKTLSGRGLLSPVDLQTADTRLKVAEASYQAAFDAVRSLKAQLQDRRASYDLAAKKLADTQVKAPISGGVSERLVQEGEFIGERTPVATIVQTNPLKLRTGVQETYAGIVTPGQRVEFRVASFGDTVFTGKVAYVSPAIDQAMRTFTVEALVDNNDHRLKPGFFAKGAIFTRIDNGVLAVPDAAVSTLAGVSSVYVVDKGKIAQVTVTLGVRQGNVWEVVDGLKGDETLAASNLNQLATGVAVKALGAGEPDGSGSGRRGPGAGRGQGEGGGGRGQRQGGGQPGVRQ
ncbi:MAG TPA: efflux RND transporter periplasmic adaptor subunit [Vicinamibacterales bacterium]|jgi:RND family efflux transporter MFP subunit